MGWKIGSLLGSVDVPVLQVSGRLVWGAEGGRAGWVPFGRHVGVTGADPLVTQSNGDPGGRQASWWGWQVVAVVAVLVFARLESPEAAADTASACRRSLCLGGVTPHS